MVNIADFAVTEYRKRRAERLKGRMDDEWITVNGTHVMIDDDGDVTKGPDVLKGSIEKKKTELSGAAKPSRKDYDFDLNDDAQDFVHKNVEKLRPIYDESGSEGLQNEWYKVRLQECTGDFKELPVDDVEEIIEDNIDDYTFHMWYNEYSHGVKPKFVYQLTQNKEIHNAALNVMYDNYRYMCKEKGEKPLSYEDFLVTPIKMYRGGNGKAHKSVAPFTSYTFDKEVAEQFRDSEIGSKQKTDKGVIYEAEIRPIDTYGSLLTNGEMEIFVPGFIAPNGRKDEAERFDGWEWSDPVKWAYEDALEVLENTKELERARRNELLDAIIQDAEMVGLFNGNRSSVGQQVVGRCVESIQKTVLQLTALYKAENEDSAFFSGELNGNLGEREVLYPEATRANMDAAWDEWLEEHLDDFENDDEQIKFRDGEWGGFKPKDAEAVEEVDSAWDAYKKKKRVDSFRERRQKRLDAKEPDAWITVNGNHIPVDENGKPVGGQQKALGSVNIGSTAKRDFNSRLNDVIGSSDSSEVKIKKVSGMLTDLPEGSRIDFPDSWTSDDGTKNYALSIGEGRWRVRYGRGKDDTYVINSEEMAGYMIYEDEGERAKLTKVPGEKKERPHGEGKYKHDGSVKGNHLADFHNEHVSQEDRDWIRNNIPKHINSGIVQHGMFDRRAYHSAGVALRDEIERRHKLRKKDKDDFVYDSPGPEDVFDVLRDTRPFGPSDEFKKNRLAIISDADEDRTKEVVNEALSMFPTDWFESTDGSDLSVRIVDGAGRAHYNGGNVVIYTKNTKDLVDIGVPEEKCDRQLVNELAHEVGHFMENKVEKLQIVARKCLADRTKDSEEEELDEYPTKPDTFFSSYLGKQYPWGDTEIISSSMAALGSSEPLAYMTGKSGFGKKDRETLKFMLGILGGL